MELTAKEFLEKKNPEILRNPHRKFAISEMMILLEEYHQAKMEEHKEKLLNEAKKIPMATGGWIAKRLGYRS